MTSSFTCGTICGPRLKYVFSYVNTREPHISFLFLCIIRKRQQRKNVTKALAFTRLFPLLIGHFLVPKTHYFQNEAKCKTFHKKWFPYKGFVLSLSLKQRLKTTRKWPVCVENNENQQGLHYCLHWKDAAPIRVKAKYFVEFDRSTLR